MTRSRTQWNLVVWMSVVLLNRGVAAQGSAIAPGDQPAQIEKGRHVVAQVCATCHTTIVRMIQVHKQTAQQWKDTVYFMISPGRKSCPMRSSL